MIFRKKILPKKPHIFFLDVFLNEYWFAPQDVLLRSIEANIWKQCNFSSPVLDIGVGDGGVSKYIYYDKKPIDVGIDPNPIGLEQAKQTKKYKKIIKASAEKMPFPNASFSTIISNSTFEHIHHDFKAVAEVGRTLKKGGIFFLTVPSEHLPTNILDIEGNNSKAKKALQNFNERVAHYHYHSVSEWEKVFNKSGMEVVYHKLYYGKFTTSIWYFLFKFSTKKINNKEIWSYLAHTRVKKIIPISIYKALLKTFLLLPAFNKGFFCEKNEKGSMLFIVGKKR